MIKLVLVKQLRVQVVFARFNAPHDLLLSILSAMKFKIRSGSVFYYCDQFGEYVTAVELANPDFKPCVLGLLSLDNGYGDRPCDIVYNPFCDEFRVKDFHQPGGVVLPLISDDLYTEELRAHYLDNEPQVYAPIVFKTSNSVVIGHNAIAHQNSVAIGYNAVATSNSVVIGSI